MVVHGGYDDQWKGGGWIVTVFYRMFRQKIRRGNNAGCQCAYIQY